MQHENMGAVPAGVDPVNSVHPGPKVSRGRYKTKPKREFTSMLTVLLEQGDDEKLRRIAGPRGLSDWVRQRIREWPEPPLGS